MLLGLLVCRSVAVVTVCLYGDSDEHCPPESAGRHFTTQKWADYERNQAIRFNTTGSIDLVYAILTDLNDWNMINLEALDGTENQNTVVFRSIGPYHRTVFLESGTENAAWSFTFYNCSLNFVMDPGDVWFQVLNLQNSSCDTAHRLRAINALFVDIWSAARMDYLTGDDIDLLFESTYWPTRTLTVKLSMTRRVMNLRIGGINTPMTLRMFGDLFLFRRPGYAAPVYVDVQEAQNAPVVHLDQDGGQLTVYCDYYVRRYYDPPGVIFMLRSSSPLIFGNQSWPLGYTNLVRVATEGRHKQQVWVRVPIMPLSIRTWWGINEYVEPMGDMDAPGFYLSELTVYADTPSCWIIGNVSTQASDVHFDTHLTGPVNLTLSDLLEYPMAVPPEGDTDRGIYPRINNPQMHVRFLRHEKHEQLNVTSRFGGAGTWAWDHFPRSQGSTGVQNLLIDSDRVYELYYGYRWGGNLNSALAQYDDFSFPTITFTGERVLNLMPIYYWGEDDRQSNDFLQHQWPGGKSPDQPRGYPALVFFQNVLEDFKVNIVEPGWGPPGFERSTYFFDWVWHEDTKSVRMVWKQRDGQDIPIANFNYRFCYNPHGLEGVCPPDYAVLDDMAKASNYVQPNAAQLRLALCADLDWTNGLEHFTGPLINVRVFAPQGDTTRPRLTVPHTFLDGDKFSFIELSNLTLAFNGVQNPQIELSQTERFDFHNVTFDSETVIGSLLPSGCADTDVIRCDPISYFAFQNHCSPNWLILDEGLYNKITFGNGVITLHYDALGFALPVAFYKGRPSVVEIQYHAPELTLEIEGNPSWIPRTIIRMFPSPFNRWTFGPGWKPAFVANLTIDNLWGTFILNDPFVPFTPGQNVVSGGWAGQGMIRILFAENHSTIDHQARVYAPFPGHARINLDNRFDSNMARLRYQDLEIRQPMELAGQIEELVLAKTVTIDPRAGLNVAAVTYDDATLKVEYRLQGGMPRLYLGTRSSPDGRPFKLQLVHQGASEFGWMLEHSDFMRLFSHELICGGGGFDCSQWVSGGMIEWIRDRTADNTSWFEDFHVLTAVCRPQVEGMLRMCLALEVEPYYFPAATLTASPSPRATASTIPPPTTFPPLQTLVPLTPPATYSAAPPPSTRTAAQTAVPVRSPTRWLPVASASPMPTPSVVIIKQNQFIGRGIGIGLGSGLGVLIIGVVAFFVWRRLQEGGGGEPLLEGGDVTYDAIPEIGGL